MIYGYVRISNKSQNAERQIRNILDEFPDAYIVKEIFTGTTSERPEWQKLLKKIRQGDGIVFDSVSRMSRNADEGFETYKGLFGKGINLFFLKEPHINTDTYRTALTGQISETGTDVDLILEGINKYLLRLAEQQIRLAFEQAEKEVQDLRQRTKEGMLTARLNGKQIGRRKGCNIITEKEIRAKKEIIKKAKEFGGIYTDKDLMKVIGISSGTYYRYKKELKKNML